MEVMLLRQNSIEHRLKALFTEGDDNGDGVLSFEEFNKIVGRYNHTLLTTFLSRENEHKHKHQQRAQIGRRR